MVLAAEKLREVLKQVPEVRMYVWDTGPYVPVMNWEAAALEAVEAGFGKESDEYRELSAAIEDQSWRDTNRPEAVAPEVFVNRDFQLRIDRIERMLNDYLGRLQAREAAPAERPAAPRPKPAVKARPRKAAEKAKAKPKKKKAKPKKAKARKAKGKKKARKRKR
jgi:hypothetical protein